MQDKDIPGKLFPSAGEDAGNASKAPETPQTLSPSHRLAYTDQEFLLRDELRSVRLQLELLKPELLLNEYGIFSTVVVFGSTRIPHPDQAAVGLAKARALSEQNPADSNLSKKLEIAERILENSRYYDEARKLGHLITSELQDQQARNLVVVTGGGPGLMEVANRGGYEADGQSVGLNIVLPREQRPNAFITPELSFQFHYFAIRKMHFLMRAKALVVFPGGFGTLDELFETLTLIQTGKIQRVPVLLFGQSYWQRVLNFDALVEEGTIDIEDLNLFQYVESAEDACQAIGAFCQLIE